jgi:hypothetical protein
MTPRSDNVGITRKVLFYELCEERFMRGNTAIRKPETVNMTFINS